jgi:phosphatidylserine decarboxylase
VIGKSTFIDGQYYTVNPQAIRTTLDVYGENVRKIVPIESPQFGTVMTVWVGAMSESRSLHGCFFIAEYISSPRSGRQYRHNRA